MTGLSALPKPIALGLLLLTSSSVLAQTGSSEHEAPPRKEITEGIFGSVRVLDAPFSADVLTTWRPTGGRPERRATARYHRDRAGHVRVEQWFVGHASDQGPQRIIVANSDSATLAYVLDSAARTVFEIGRGAASVMVGGYHGSAVLPVSMTRFVAFLAFPAGDAPSNSALDEEDLGQRSISGVQAAGTRIRATLPAWARGGARDIERWVSPELKLVVYSRSEDDVIGVVEHQLTEIRLGDPAATLFEVPRDYVATAATFPWWWANPYRPDLTPWIKP